MKDLIATGRLFSSVVGKSKKSKARGGIKDHRVIADKRKLQIYTTVEYADDVVADGFPIFKFGKDTRKRWAKMVSTYAALNDKKAKPPKGKK